MSRASPLSSAFASEAVSSSTGFSAFSAFARAAFIEDQFTTEQRRARRRSPGAQSAPISSLRELRASARLSCARAGHQARGGGARLGGDRRAREHARDLL